jgi:hypothetical protein
MAIAIDSGSATIRHRQARHRVGLELVEPVALAHHGDELGRKQLRETGLGCGPAGTGGCAHFGLPRKRRDRRQDVGGRRRD